MMPDSPDYLNHHDPDCTGAWETFWPHTMIVCRTCISAYAFTAANVRRASRENAMGEYLRTLHDPPKKGGGWNPDWGKKPDNL